MAYLGKRLSDTPIDLAADTDFNLAHSTEYVVQNKSQAPLWTLDTSAAGTPDVHSEDVYTKRISIRPWGTAIVKWDDGDKFWIWYPRGREGSFAISPSF